MSLSEIVGIAAASHWINGKMVSSSRTSAIVRSKLVTRTCRPAILILLTQMASMCGRNRRSAIGLLGDPAATRKLMNWLAQGPSVCGRKKTDFSTACLGPPSMLVNYRYSRGGMCERLKQAVLKTALPLRVTGVRIPLPPPLPRPQGILEIPQSS